LGRRAAFVFSCVVRLFPSFFRKIVKSRRTARRRSAYNKIRAARVARTPRFSLRNVLRIRTTGAFLSKKEKKRVKIGKVLLIF
jgi:hypothetical protein